MIKINRGAWQDDNEPTDEALHSAVLQRELKQPQHQSLAARLIEFTSQTCYQDVMATPKKKSRTPKTKQVYVPELSEEERALNEFVASNDPHGKAAERQKRKKRLDRNARDRMDDEEM